MRSSVILFVLILASVGLAQAPPSAQKPLDKDQVMTLVTAGMDNAQLAKKIEELGVDLSPRTSTSRPYARRARRTCSSRRCAP